MASKPSVIVRDASVVTARPVVPPPIAEYEPPYALASGSQLNKTAVGGPYAATELDSGSSLSKSQQGSPWPPIIDGAIKFFVGWRPNAFRQIANHNVSGNYGSKTSLANYGFRGWEFPNAQAGLPDSMVQGNGHPPEWNNLVPIIWGLRVLNPVMGGSSNLTTQPAKVVSQMTRPTDFLQAGTASLSMRNEVLQ